MKQAYLRAGGLSLIATALASTAGAQQPILMDEILVTGGLTPVDTSQTGRAFTILTGEQLEARGTRYVADALRQVPGLAVSRTGSFGGFTQVRVRGAEANQVLVLIDGVEVAPASTGELDFGSLVVTDIERIEVLRGPQSALFGSNASAGVIQIFTRRGARNDVSIGGRVEGGSDATALIAGHLSGGGETWDGALSFSFRRTDGFNVATGTDDREGELDGDSNITVNARGNWDVTDDLEIGGVFRVVDRESDFDAQLFPFPADATSGLVVDSDSVNDARDLSFAVFGRYEMLDDALVHELRFEFADSISDSLVDGVSTFTSEGQRFTGSALSSYGFNTGPVESVVTALLEVEEEINEATTGNQTRTLIGLAGEYQGTFFNDFSLQAGIRYDINDAFENALTYAVGASYLYAPTGTRLHGSVGRGVVNPTFFEQFGFSPGMFIGNPDLEPEETFQWDIGIEQSLFDDRLILDATYFRGNVNEEIVGSFDPIALLPTSVNAPGESPRQGVELQMTATPIDPLTVIASYTYTLAEEGSTDLQEVRRPRHMASFDALYRFFDDRARLNLGVVYTGDQRDLDFTAGTFPAPIITLDDFILVSIQGSYQATENVELFARVENLTNADYQEVFNFETQGIAGFAGLRLRF
ncbi:MAG: TonB-dependent receptor [Pseudomonadota bacterium]